MAHKWIKHDNKGIPTTINRETLVVAELIDGHQLCPLRAGDIDWKHSDAVVRYRIVED